jgi:polyisoprenoid-binding protein YceI
MRKPAFVVALVLVALSSARADNYTFDAAKSRIAFSVHHLIGTARGEFRKFSGTIEVDPNQPERSSVNVKIQVASIDTEIRKRDDHLLSAEFFDAKQFPEITFRSRSVKRLGPNRGDVLGDLTMHGITRPLTLHVTLATPLAAGSVPERTRWIVTSDPIRRKDFGLMFASAAEAMSGIGQDVTPTIEIEAVRGR